MPGDDAPATPALLTGVEDDRLPPNLKLQILTTEHWSLLSTRALSWNEAFSRATMFLSVLSGAVLSLALVAGVTSFDGVFATFALFVLPVVLFAGVATFRRLVEINREDVGWVVGMNHLRRAYLDAAPELQPYFVTGWSDDEAGIMKTFGATPGPGAFVHEFATTPGLIAVVDGVVAGALVAIVGLWIGAAPVLALTIAVAAAVATVGLLLRLQFDHVVRPRARREPRFPIVRDDDSDRSAASRA